MTHETFPRLEAFRRAASSNSCRDHRRSTVRVGARSPKQQRSSLTPPNAVSTPIISAAPVRAGAACCARRSRARVQCCRRDRVDARRYCAGRWRARLRKRGQRGGHERVISRTGRDGAARERRRAFGRRQIFWDRPRRRRVGRDDDKANVSFSPDGHCDYEREQLFRCVGSRPRDLLVHERRDGRCN